jgi:hypothetical protein
MGYLFEDTAADFGVASPEADYNEEIYAPVQLSNTTKRITKPVDLAQEQVDYYSMSGKLNREKEDYERKRQADLLQIDKMQDEAYDRQIEMRAKAAQWNDKVKAQEHGSAVSGALTSLDPTDPEYQSKVDSLISQYPLAPFDAKIKSVLDSKKALFDSVKTERDKVRDAAIARSNSDYNAQRQLEVNKLTTDYSNEVKTRDDVSKMSKEARSAFNESMSADGSNIYEARGAANDVASTEVTFKDYDTALERVNDLGRTIKAYRTEKDKLATNLAADPATVEKLSAAYDADIEAMQKEMRSKQLRFIDPYEKKKGGDTQERPEPSSSAKPSRMSVKSLLPGSK